ncbi:hypothetical protein [Xenorhabdus japonica]|uniref:Uncharacterized protein n=1 Tax=Xenorhabdus japonica TaxID=53341 RepID=A0A1I4ZR31_9GAMM|nr:hypothetical protein [Xenorhabdus japonica]SFN52721.1 hypothetical protein SAMN05421579_10764 [Xenorhabdus japonica]
MKKGTSVSVVSILVVLLVLAIVYFAFRKGGFAPSIVSTGNVSTLNTASKGTGGTGTTKQDTVSSDKPLQGTVSLAKPSDQASKRIESLTEHASVAFYIHKHHKLPPYYILKKKLATLVGSPIKEIYVT